MPDEHPILAPAWDWALSLFGLPEGLRLAWGVVVAASPESAHAERQSLIRFGEFQLDLQTGELSRNGTKNRLQGQPLQLLELLSQHPGQLVTREQIQQYLWPDGTVVEFEHSVNAAVKRLRESLGDNAENPAFIETIPRRGYRFIAPLANVSSAAVSRSGTEPAFIPAHDATPAEVSRPSVLPVEKKAAPSRLRLSLWAATALAVLAAGFALYQARRATGTRQPAIKSLAVLPLKNLSGNPSQEYLADGMTEELIGRLSMIHGLRVISRTSVMRFKDAKLSVQEIAKTLGVDGLVEGSVIREGNRIRVHAQLIRGATDEHFWSETYDRELRDALALESEVAQSIAEKVEVTVTAEERARLASAHHVAPEVYENYLKGEFQLEGNSRAEIEQSVAYFEEAIRRDATFAPAYVGLAEAYDGLSSIFVGASPEITYPKVISAARKALELDPHLAEAHALLADMEQVRWHWGEAETEYRQALELKPNDVTVHQGFANWLLCQGRTEEALAWALRARELDPLGVRGVQIGWILFQARRYDEAIQELRSALAVRPDDASVQWTLGFVLIGNGQPEEAIPLLEKTAAIMHRSPGSIELLATAHARAGHRAEAIRLINELKERRKKTYIPAGALINPHLALGEYDQAFVWFERAYEEKSSILQFLKVHPFFDPVRNDPRFADLLHRVGLD